MTTKKRKQDDYSKENALVKVVEFKSINFNGTQIIGIKGSDGKIYTPVKKICEDLGVSFQGQSEKINKNKILSRGINLILIPSVSGNQDTLCIDVSFLPMWLIKISPSKCKPEIEPLLLEFQLKAKEVLEKAFINASNNAEPIKSQAEILLGSIQLIVDLEKGLKETNAKVDKILATQEENTNKFFEIEKSDVLPFQETTKIKLKKLVNHFSGATGIVHGKVWKRIYKEFYYRYGKNLPLLAQRQNKTGVQIAEELFLIDDLFNLASELLDVDKFKPDDYAQEG